MTFSGDPLLKIQNDMARSLTDIPNTELARISEAARLFDEKTKNFPGLFTRVEKNNIEYTNQIGDVYYLNQEYEGLKLNKYMSGKNFICVVYYLEFGCESVRLPWFKIEYGEGPNWMNVDEPDSITEVIENMILDCYE